MTSLEIMCLGLSQSVRRGRVLEVLAVLCMLVSVTVPEAMAKPGKIRATYGGTYQEIEFRSVETPNEGKIRSIRAEQIKQLKLALARHLPEKRRADIYFELAELYLESYRAWFILEGRVHEKRMSAKVTGETIRRDRSKPFISLGIRSCEDILKFNIKSNKLDQIYFFLGFYYGELDQDEKSKSYYLTLAQKFPSSVYVGEAYKSLGDYSYRKTKYADAVQYFERALKYAQKDRVPQLRMKLGWSYYRTRAFDKAVQQMKEVLFATHQVGDQYVGLREEALRDVTTFMVETTPPEAAISYLRDETKGGEESARSLEQLASAYERVTKYPSAMVVYKAILSNFPKTVIGIRVGIKMIELDLSKGQLNAAKEALKRFQIPEKPDAETEAKLQNLRVQVRKVATAAHNRYRTYKKPADRAVAEAFYRAYVETFLVKNDPHKEIPEMQMYLAELLKDEGKLDAVNQLYKKVALSKDPRFSKKALQLWVAGLAESLKKGGSKGGDEASTLEKDFVEASDELRASIGVTKETLEASLRAAQVLAGHPKTIEDAIKRAKKIIKDAPSSDQAWIAAKLWYQLVDDQRKRGQDMDLGKVVSELRDQPELLKVDAQKHKGEIRAALEQYDTERSIQRIAKLEKNKDFEEAAEAYLEFASKSKDKQAAEAAYKNAINSYLKAEKSNFKALEDALRLWETRFPGSKLELEASRLVATNALIQGQFVPAAVAFERLGTALKDPASMETASRLFEIQGSFEHASALSMEASRLKKKPELRFEILKRSGEMREKRKDYAGAQNAYRACGSREALPLTQIECLTRLADLLRKDQSGSEEALSIFQKIVSAANGRLKGELKGSPFVGYAFYRLAESFEQKTDLPPLKYPKTNLEMALNKRLEFLGLLSKNYQRAVEAGGPWAIAALHRIALFVANFAEEMDLVEPEPPLVGKAYEKFRAELGQVSGPLRDKAKVTWTDAYQKASQYGLLTPVLPEVADALADLKAARPGRAQGPKGHFHFAGLQRVKGEVDEALKKTRDRLLKNAKDASAWVDYGNLSEDPGFARFCYENALAIDPKHMAAANNLVTLGLKLEGQENWIPALVAAQQYEQILKRDDLFMSAKINYANLLNYYRAFTKAHVLWDHLLVRYPQNEEVLLGSAISLQGSNEWGLVSQAFEKAGEKPSNDFEWIKRFHEVARMAYKGEFENCVSESKDIKQSKLDTVEKRAVEHLSAFCEKQIQSDDLRKQQKERRAKEQQRLEDEQKEKERLKAEELEAKKKDEENRTPQSIKRKGSKKP